MSQQNPDGWQAVIRYHVGLLKDSWSILLAAEDWRQKLAGLIGVILLPAIRGVFSFVTSRWPESRAMLSRLAPSDFLTVAIPILVLLLFALWLLMEANHRRIRVFENARDKFKQERDQALSEGQQLFGEHKDLASLVKKLIPYKEYVEVQIKEEEKAARLFPAQQLQRELRIMAIELNSLSSKPAPRQKGEPGPTTLADVFAQATAMTPGQIVAEYGSKAKDVLQLKSRAEEFGLKSTDLDRFCSEDTRTPGTVKRIGEALDALADRMEPFTREDQA